jgi:hypothetical protein
MPLLACIAQVRTFCLKKVVSPADFFGAGPPSAFFHLSFCLEPQA